MPFTPEEAAGLRAFLRKIPRVKLAGLPTSQWLPLEYASWLFRWMFVAHKLEDLVVSCRVGFPEAFAHV